VTLIRRREPRIRSFEVNSADALNRAARCTTAEQHSIEYADRDVSRPRRAALEADVSEAIGGS